MARGRLRIYLGAAPGVGKTYAMLNEGWRGHERGKDVVVGYVETHGRPATDAQLRNLEVVPRRQITYRGQEREEMDLDAILARRPEVALVDEMAHTNVPGSRNTKRWQDIEQLLAAGIDVVSTVNIQHLESLSDVVTVITGAVQRERVPDQVVRAADQLELVDMSPESLRRRMAHGNIYRPEQIEPALSNYFRVGNLSALRELALLWVADRVDEGLQEYRERHGIGEPWETKERVVVALTDSPGGEQLIRRGARMAARTHAELVGVHIRPVDGISPSGGKVLDAHRLLLQELGGRYSEVTANDTGSALVNFAREQNATQLLLGATQRSRWGELVRGSVINQVIRAANGIDIHVLSSPVTGEDESRRLPRLPEPGHLTRLPPRRRLAGWILALGGIPLLCAVLVWQRGQLGTTSGLPELLAAVVVVACVGGVLPALVAAALSFGLADWYLIPPVHSWTIGRSSVGSLVAFVVVAVTVSLLIDRLARRTLDTARAKAESEALARLAGGAVLAGRSGTAELVDEVRATFGVDGVVVLGRPDDPSATEWHVIAASGTPLPQRPEDGVFSAELAEGSVLVIGGRSLTPGDRRLLGVFVTQLRLVQARQNLEAAAASATSLAETNELRTALLAAVSHDLRTPLASIKASATSLLSEEVKWSPEAQRAFYETIETEADRLNDLVDNLLDMSRLQTGALGLTLRPVGLDEVVFAALASISGDTSAVSVDVPESLTIVTDPALLERAVANLVANALAFSPPGTVHVVGTVEIPELGLTRADEVVDPATGACGRVELRIIDRGPGIPVNQRGAVFQPFQRLGDGGNAHADGVGLGLAVARGFVEAVHGRLELDDTPGGGLTATLSLPGLATPPALPVPERTTPDRTTPERIDAADAVP